MIPQDYDKFWDENGNLKIAAMLSPKNACFWRFQFGENAWPIVDVEQRPYGKTVLRTGSEPPKDIRAQLQECNPNAIVFVEYEYQTWTVKRQLPSHWTGHYVLYMVDF